MVCQGGASLLLGRILKSSDFGLVNFSAIVTGFVGQFNDIGVDSAVIQRAQPTARTLSTAFTVKLAMSATMMILLWVLARPLAAILQTPDAIPIIRLLSLTFLTSALSFVPSVRLRKALHFHSIAQVWVWSTLAGGLCSIILALTGAGYWSIAIGQVAANLASLIAFQCFQPSSYRLGFDWHECQRLLSFGGRVFLSNLLVFACFNIDNFLVGKKLGAEALGQYSMAFNWATQICGFISATVFSVLFPAFSNLDGNRDKICGLYLSSLRQVGLAGALGYGVFVFVAPEFLVLILGGGTSKWIAALPVLQILCIYGIFRQLLEPFYNVLMALHRADLLWRSAVIVLVTSFASIVTVLSVGGGIVSVAWCVFASYALQYFYYLPHARSNLGITAWAILRCMIPAIGTVLALTYLSSICTWQISWALLCWKLFLGSLAALLLYALLGGYEDIVTALRQLRSRGATFFDRFHSV
jgi:O-antigen/teichoic acid export membrane protein